MNTLFWDWYLNCQNEILKFFPFIDYAKVFLMKCFLMKGLKQHLRTAHSGVIYTIFLLGVLSFFIVSIDIYRQGPR